MTQRELTQWLRAFRYFGDLLRAHGLCGRGWPDIACGKPAGHEGDC